MKIAYSQFVLRIIALFAAILFPGLALADRHDDTGFYIGAGAYSSSAELDLSAVFDDSDGLSSVASGTFTLDGGVPDATVIAAVSTYFIDNVADVATFADTISVTPSEDSDFGFGVHAGFKVNKYFAFEVGYAEIGEFSGTGMTVSASDIELDANITVKTPTVRLSLTEEVSILSASVLGQYELADNASVYGRLGYYTADISEELSLDISGDIDGSRGVLILGGTGTSTSPQVDEDSGLLYGAGFEVNFGRNQNFMLRGELNVLADGLGDADDITQFGLTGSYKF